MPTMYNMRCRVTIRNLDGPEVMEMALEGATLALTPLTQPITMDWAGPGGYPVEEVFQRQDLSLSGHCVHFVDKEPSLAERLATLERENAVLARMLHDKGEEGASEWEERGRRKGIEQASVALQVLAAKGSPPTGSLLPARYQLLAEAAMAVKMLSPAPVTLPPDRAAAEIARLREALEGLLDGLDCNHQYHAGGDPMGLAPEQWSQRIDTARKALEGG